MSNFVDLMKAPRRQYRSSLV